MVETVRCEHCGAKTKHPVTKTIDDRPVYFCCVGCEQVYEFLRAEGLLEQVRAEEERERKSK
jgi:hypothetical protein